jgi:hypothetical protein
VTQSKPWLDVLIGLAALCLITQGCGPATEADLQSSQDALDISTEELTREDDSDDRVPAPFNLRKPYRPDFDKDETTAMVTQRFFPLPVGARWTYRSVTDEGMQRIEVQVLAGTKRAFGVATRIVRDVAYLDDEKVEDTLDFFAQDDDNNVWYLGERTTEFEGGVPVSTAGSWEAGIRGALPGIVMLNRPRVGDVYRQEYFKGEAEDYARVVGLNKTVKVPAGTFRGCLVTRDLSVIEPALDELKYYCPGIGLTLIIEGDVREELVSYSGLKR